MSADTPATNWFSMPPSLPSRIADASFPTITNASCADHFVREPRTTYARRKPLELIAWLPWAIPGTLAGL